MTSRFISTLQSRGNGVREVTRNANALREGSRAWFGALFSGAVGRYSHSGVRRKGSVGLVRGSELRYNATSTEIRDGFQGVLDWVGRAMGSMHVRPVTT